MSSRRLEDLSDRFRPLAEKLLAGAAEADIPVRIIETRRTEEEHQANLARGVSWTKHSRHIDGDAIDIAPIEVLGLKNWAPQNQAWKRLGDIGESLGLTWGGRWTQRDMCHFEYAEVPADERIA